MSIDGNKNFIQLESNSELNVLSELDGDISQAKS